ncbi:ropporin-1-like [Scleropages formosus]|uniref:Ropporin-1-like n=1 Tax=Scleropages formosus TaxID=113540 RepID=A0A8C9T148_SCLFO|nr:ropporin-1-like [Scleropages formosus]XP_018598681.1 ropporin-1-like [Scleropages formosus]XP_018598682.1 ropporin-1-like [Scleropages formosus]
MADEDRQFEIPVKLPEILKQFTKDAIRTQPADIIQWAALYFSALVEGQPVPVAEPAAQEADQDGDLTPEVLTAMHSEFCERETVSKAEVAKTWQSFGLPDDLLKRIFLLYNFGEHLNWIKFLALGCKHLGGTLKNAMIHACYIMDPACKPPDAGIPFETFRFLYTYLAALDEEVTVGQVERALTYLETKASSQSGVIKVSDFISNREVRLG